MMDCENCGARVGRFQEWALCPECARITDEGTAALARGDFDAVFKAAGELARISVESGTYTRPGARFLKLD